jgi:hypothetical protein
MVGEMVTPNQLLVKELIVAFEDDGEGNDEHGE